MEGTKRGHIRREKSLRCKKKRKQQKYVLRSRGVSIMGYWHSNIYRNLYRNSNSLDHVKENGRCFGVTILGRKHRVDSSRFCPTIGSSSSSNQTERRINFCTADMAINSVNIRFSFPC